ncbi:serine/threonine-protein kinase [Methylotuvimicrobium sp. KM2]|uniref:serine/threonine-protein kinase n=1 Tax=Methylotuvimicrobium sp. KM2 TaxID=3133976 RepID=UPI0031013BCD
MDRDPKESAVNRTKESDETIIQQKPRRTEGNSDLYSARTQHELFGTTGGIGKTATGFDEGSPYADGSVTPGSGSVLKNRYDLLEKIGTGGMGSVYKALDRRDIEAGNSAFIAVKVLNDEFRANPELLKAMHSEARKTQSLAHPNILTVYDFDRDGPIVFMTMEYLEGVTLDKIVKNHPAGLEHSEALAIIRQICAALSHAHAKGIIHSDFKPSNVFIDIHNRVKILDFGIARLQNFSRVGSFDAGVLGGMTPAYATLEMLHGEKPDPRDDIYALACVAYELFAGFHPFNRQRVDYCLQKKLQPKPIRSLNARQWHALKKGLQFKREDRIDSVEAFLKGLESRNKPYQALYYVLPVAILLGASAMIRPYWERYSIEKPENEALTEAPIDKTAAQLDAEETVANEETSEVSTPLNGKVDQNFLPEHIFTVSINKTDFKIGESLIVDFQVEQALYVYIAVIDAAGAVGWVYPNPYQEENYSLPGKRYRIPPEEGDFTIDIGEPKGTDQVIAIASPDALPIELIDVFNPEKLKENYRVVIKILEFTIR